MRIDVVHAVDVLSMQSCGGITEHHPPTTEGIQRACCDFNGFLESSGAGIRPTKLSDEPSADCFDNGVSPVGGIEFLADGADMLENCRP